MTLTYIAPRGSRVYVPQKWHHCRVSCCNLVPRAVRDRWRSARFDSDTTFDSRHEFLPFRSSGFPFFVGCPEKQRGRVSRLYLHECTHSGFSSGGPRKEADYERKICGDNYDALISAIQREINASKTIQEQYSSREGRRFVGQARGGRVRFNRRYF